MNIKVIAVAIGGCVTIVTTVVAILEKCFS